MEKVEIKNLKRVNQNVRTCINQLERNKEKIATNLSEEYDYYSFIRGFEWVLDELKYALKD